MFETPTTTDELFKILQEDEIFHISELDDLIKLGFIVVETPKDQNISDIHYNCSLIFNDYKVTLIIKKAYNGLLFIKLKQFTYVDNDHYCQFENSPSKISYNSSGEVNEKYYYKLNKNRLDNNYFKTISYFEDLVFERNYSEEHFYLSEIIYTVYNKNDIEKSSFILNNIEIDTKVLAMINHRFLNLSYDNLQNIVNKLTKDEINILEMALL